MKWNTIEDILTSFENDVHEINVEPEMLQKASKAIKRMLLV